MESWEVDVVESTLADVSLRRLDRFYDACGETDTRCDFTAFTVATGLFWSSWLLDSLRSNYISELT